MAGGRKLTGFKTGASGPISKRAGLHSRRKPAGATRFYARRLGRALPLSHAAPSSGTGAQRIGSVSGVTARHTGSHSDTAMNSPLNDESPVSDRACRKKSWSDSEFQKWRRRESNPRPEISLRKLLRV